MPYYIFFISVHILSPPKKARRENYSTPKQAERTIQTRPVIQFLFFRFSTRVDGLRVFVEAMSCWKAREEAHRTRHNLNQPGLEIDLNFSHGVDGSNFCVHISDRMGRLGSIKGVCSPQVRRTLEFLWVEQQKGHWH